MSKSSIEWTDATWNPIAGCTKVSEGCKNCYAEKMAKRLKAMNIPKYFSTVNQDGWTGLISLDFLALDIPRKTKKPTRYFVNSMSDLFHENVPDYFIDEVFKVIKETPRHTYQVLTKRPERMHNYVMHYHSIEGNMPIDNLWLGVSVENQRTADERIPFLLSTRAALRFLSCEPLLGEIDLNKNYWPNFLTSHLPDEKCIKWIDLLAWVIVGGESGPYSRPINPDWVRNIKKQCDKKSVAFFFKQWGGVNKKKNGRELDGMVYDSLPESFYEVIK